MPATRVQQTLERLQEDEALFGDLDDRAAEVLRQWIEQQVTIADGLADDAAFEQQVAQIRAAAKAATRANGADAGAIVALAEQAQRGDLTRSVAPAAPDESPPVSRDVRSSPAAALLQAAPVAAPPPPGEAQPAAETASAAQRSAPSTLAPTESTNNSAAPPRSMWSRMRRRWRRWTQRKARS